MLLAVPLAAAQAAPPAPTPQPQTTDRQQPPVSGTVPGDQVPNMPGYDQKVVTVGPPAEAPLPPPPPLPPPSPAPAQQPIKVMPPYARDASDDTVYVPSALGSVYIPLDSWINDAVLRLYSLGYVDTAYLGMRPYTRLSILHMLARCAKKLDATEPPDSQAREIYETLRDELSHPVEDPLKLTPQYKVTSVYSRVLGITGHSLNILDSYTVGQTFINDYGRPYANGFNNVTGFSAFASDQRFSFYFRGEYQHAPGWMGFDDAQTNFLQAQLQNFLLAFPPNGEPTLTVPSGAVAAQNNLRILETDVAVHLAGHEISVGKHDEWLGPNQGGAFAYSNNAEPIYAFKINRVEPLYIPFVDKVLGPLRYEFFVGSLKGHSIPNDPWVHVEKFSFKPTENFEFGFTRDVIWGGRDHEGVSFGTFWRSFYSISDTNPVEKCIVYPSGQGTNPPSGYPPPHVPHCTDPGARFSAFDYSYRLPWLRNWITWTLDSFVHDDVTPISAPRRSAIRTGLYLSHVPNVPKLDMRFEAALTDPDTGASQGGSFMYYETIQHEGITNTGVIFGDAIGREDKGGQAWVTYHLSPMEMVQVTVRNTKAAKDFIPGGTTQWDYSAAGVKRLTHDFELKGQVQYEHYLIPFLQPGAKDDTSLTLQLTWFPRSTLPVEP